MCTCVHVCESTWDDNTQISDYPRKTAFIYILGCEEQHLAHTLGSVTW